MMSVVEWGHARNCIVEDDEFCSYFEDEEEMSMCAEYWYDVNETALLADNNIFNLAENDHDSHNPIIIHLQPAENTWKDKHELKAPEAKMRRAATRKENRKANKRRGWTQH